MHYILKGFLPIKKNKKVEDAINDALVMLIDNKNIPITQTIIHLNQVDSIETTIIDIDKNNSDLIPGLLIDFKNGKSKSYYFQEQMDRDLAFSEIALEIKSEKTFPFEMKPDWRNN